jgi:hypothetical protein
VVNVILRELVQSVLHLRLKAIQSVLDLRLKAIQSVLDLRQALIYSVVQSCDSIIHLVQRDYDIDLSKRENTNNQRDKRCPQHLMIFCYSTFFGFHNRACRLLSFTRKLVGGASCSNNSKTGNYSYTAVGSVFQPNRHLSTLAGAVGNGSLSHSLISRLIAPTEICEKWISIARDLLSGLAIAVIVHSLDPSLSTQLIVRLIPAYGFGASRLSVQPNVVRLYKVELRVKPVIILTLR